MKNYGKDYKKSGDGYEYIGAWYETSLPAAELKKAAKCLGGKLLAASLLLSGGLSVNNTGSHTFWVLIPYAMMILPVIYGWMGCTALMRTAKKRQEQGKTITENQEKQKEAKHGSKKKTIAGKGQEPIVHLDSAKHAAHLRRSEYEQAFRRPLRCGIATAVLAWTSFAADLVIVTAYREQAVWPVEIFFAVDAFLLCILGVWMAVSAWKVHRSAHRLEENV